MWGVGHRDDVRQPSPGALAFLEQSPALLLRCFLVQEGGFPSRGFTTEAEGFLRGGDVAPGVLTFWLWNPTETQTRGWPPGTRLTPALFTAAFLGGHVPWPHLSGAGLAMVGWGHGCSLSPSEGGGGRGAPGRPGPGSAGQGKRTVLLLVCEPGKTDGEGLVAAPAPG